MKQRARHSALQELANMMLPNLIEDIDVKKAKKTMPKEVKAAVEEAPEMEDQDDQEDFKPQVRGFSITRLMSDQGKLASKQAPPKRRVAKKKVRRR